jgi:ADP-ribose pyrophosphatase
VGILAWDGSRLAMVRQWRHATGRTLLEIPAGTLEPDERPAETARRELAEEVGLAAGTWVDGPRFYTAPGFCTELMHLFLATDLTAAMGTADPDEMLEPSWMALDDATMAIDDGRIADAKTIVAVGWLARRLP